MAASAGNAVGTIAGFKKSAEGRKMQKKAQRAIDSFEWEELQNPFEDVQVSTLGADLRGEQLGTTTASAVEALKNSGTRGILGGLGAVQANNNAVSRGIAANLDEQQKTLDFARANDNATLRAMQENRQANELAGYGQMLNTGIGMKYQGMADVQSSAQAQGEENKQIMEMAMGGMGGGGGGGGMGMSDRNLKKNINLIGESESGINIYSFEYIEPNKYGEGVYQGVMADEVPDNAVLKNKEGFDMVDYDKLDVEFKKIK